MLVRQGFQYALRPKASQEALLRQWVGCRRFVFNEGLAHQKAEVAAGRKRPGYAALCARLPALKVQHPWLAEPPAQGLQQALKDLCKAWDAKYMSRFGAPRFKKRGEGDTLYLPKLGAVRLRHSRQALGALKNVTLRQERGRWIAALQTEREVATAVTAATAAVGLDFGAATTIMPSAGPPIELPARIGRYERRMKRLQQALSRKKKGSNNRAKARQRLADCHARIGAMRRDWLHQQTTAVVREHALVALEDLAVKHMTRSAAGTLDAPGKNVAQKSALNRTILRNGWSMARGMLEYKAAWRGVMLVPVPPAYTSQTCSHCGHVDAANRPTQALFACVNCGYTDNADRNAAKNILARAHELLASQIPPGGRPANTAGYAGIQACEGAAKTCSSPRRRPRSAARGASVGAPLAGTISGLSLPGNLHP